MRKPNPALKEFRQKIEHHSPKERIAGVELLQRNSVLRRRRGTVSSLKKAVFDLDRKVRIKACYALAERIGWKATVEFIIARFSDFSKIPKGFFDTSEKLPPKQRLELLANDVEWSLFFAKKEAKKLDFQPESVERMTVDGKPYSVNGLPVFLANISEETIGYYADGILFVHKDKEILEPKYRTLIAWHEFGEIFGHTTGLFFEFYEAQKQGFNTETIPRYVLDGYDFYDMGKHWKMPRRKKA